MTYGKFHNGSKNSGHSLSKALKDPKKALGAMQRLCSMREYCSSDIVTKLKKYDLTEKETQEILLSLEKDKFLDNSRYAAAFVRDKAAFNGWGPVKIRWALKAKKIEEEIIEQAMEQLPQEGQEERLLLLLDKKLKSLSREQDNSKVRVKLLRFAVSRGFDYEKVLNGVNKIMANFVRE